LARIAGIDIPRNKRIEVALTYIYGIGRSTSQKILGKAGVDLNARTDNLTEVEVVKYVMLSTVSSKWKLIYVVTSPLASSVSWILVVIVGFVIVVACRFVDRKPRQMHVPVRVRVKQSPARRNNRRKDG
jgi:hypothetical protein